MQASNCTNPDGVMGSLVEPVRQLIYGLGWQGFTRVQESVIPGLVSMREEGGECLILAPTGSGKTEAALLPILSGIVGTIEGQSHLSGVRALYIAPLKALVNDQFGRVGALCESLGISLSRWHGDVPGHAKKKSIENPSGILQITPESLESLLINRTLHLPVIFPNLKWIIVDELHSFAGGSRGIHLRSAIHRIAGYSREKLLLIGLSATLGDPGAARIWMNPRNPDGVMVHETGSGGEGTRYAVFFRPQSVDNGSESALAGAAERTHALVGGRSALIFCSTKNRVEELAQALASLPGVAGDTGYLVHHGAMSVEERNSVEQALVGEGGSRHGIRVVCTSTLEMGVDIPALDLVVQLDSPPGVSSFVQRAGRSGRRKGEPRTIGVVTTTRESLVQTCAIINLYLKGWTEPGQPAWEPLDVAFHQTLSSIEQTRGRNPEILLTDLSANPAFHNISRELWEDLVAYMVESEYLSYIAGRDEIILGPLGERLLRSREFYSVFQGLHGYEVWSDGKLIGEVPYGGGLGYRGCPFILGGRAWQVQDLDHARRRLSAIPCETGKVPVWAGSAEPGVHQAVRSEMARILGTEGPLPYLDDRGVEAVFSMRASRRLGELGPKDRVIEGIPGGGLRFEAFAGTVIQGTVSAMIMALGGDRLLPSPWGSLVCRIWTKERTLKDILEEAAAYPFTPEELRATIDIGAEIPTKFGIHLPFWARQRLHASLCFDIGGAQDYLREVVIKDMSLSPIKLPEGTDSFIR